MANTPSMDREAFKAREKVALFMARSLSGRISDQELSHVITTQRALSEAQQEAWVAIQAAASAVMNQIIR